MYIDDFFLHFTHMLNADNDMSADGSPPQGDTEE
jgi:hypothetical protein